MLVKIVLRYENDHGYKQMKNAMIRSTCLGKCNRNLVKKANANDDHGLRPYRMKKPSRKIYRYFLVECHHGIQEKGLLSHRCRSCFMFMLQKVEMEGRTYR